VAQEFGEAVQHLVVGAGDLVDLGDAAGRGACAQVAGSDGSAVAGEVLQRGGEYARLAAGDQDGRGQGEGAGAGQDGPHGEDPVTYGGAGRGGADDPDDLLGVRHRHGDGEVTARVTTHHRRAEGPPHCRVTGPGTAARPQPQVGVVQAEASPGRRCRQFNGIAGRVVGADAHGTRKSRPFKGVALVGVQGRPDGQGQRDSEEDHGDQSGGEGHTHDTLSHALILRAAGLPGAGAPRAFAVV
jgi:hypothetical protein